MRSSASRSMLIIIVLHLHLVAAFQRQKFTSHASKTTSKQRLIDEPMILASNHQSTKFPSLSFASMSSSTVRCMVPKFDSKAQKWSPSSEEETSKAGYSKITTLLLHGPNPFFQRVFQEENYEQAVLKFMAGDQCDRNTAQGNMDAYLANPNDWAINRFEAQRNGGYQPDYVTLRTKDVVLTLTWSIVLFTYIGRAIFVLTHPGIPFLPFLSI
jgi:hypothetical protein